MSDRPDRRPPARVPAPPPAQGLGDSGLDGRLALRGGLNGLVFVAPAALAGQLLADDDGHLDTGPSLAVMAVQLLGFCFAGWVVRRLQPGAAAITCAAAGVAAWAILQAVGVVSSILRGQDLSPLTWVATALLAAMVAAAGGLLARVERLPRNPRENHP